MPTINEVRAFLRTDPSKAISCLIAIICLNNKVNVENLEDLTIELIQEESNIWRVAHALIQLHNRAQDDPVSKRIFVASIQFLSRISQDEHLNNLLIELIDFIFAIKKIAEHASRDNLSKYRLLEIYMLWETNVKLKEIEVENLINAFCGWATPATDENFQEDLYLEVNPDVKASVATGSMPSGRYHFEELGRFENRQIRQYLELADE